MPGGTAEFTSSALSRRRSRLRTTAGPTARPIANATRGGCTLGSGTDEHQSESIRTRVPSRLRRTNVSRSRIRSIKRRGAPGPWPGETSERHGLHVCSCEREIHACALGGVCWADMYASRIISGRFEARTHSWRGMTSRVLPRACQTRLRRMWCDSQPYRSNHTDVSCTQTILFHKTPGQGMFCVEFVTSHERGMFDRPSPSSYMST